MRSTAVGVSFRAAADAGRDRRCDRRRIIETHNEKIEKQARSRGIPDGALVSGDKKDVVITNLLARSPAGSRFTDGICSPALRSSRLSTVHGACYADYSHGIRLVSETAVVDGKLRSVSEMLQDPSLAKVLSDEGPIRQVWDSGPRDAGDRCVRAESSARPQRIPGLKAQWRLSAPQIHGSVLQHRNLK